MRRKLMWVLVSIFTVMALVGATIIAATYWVVEHPHATWQFLERHVLPEDLKVSFETFRLKPTRLGWLRWRVELEAKHLNIEYAGRLRTPLDEVKIFGNLSFMRPLNRFDLDSFVLRAAQPLEIWPERSADDHEVNPKDWIRDVSNLLGFAREHLSVAEMDVDLPQILIHADPQLTMKVRAQKPDPRQPIALHVQLLSSDLELGLRGLMEVAKIETSAPFLQADVSFKGFKVDSQWSVATILDDGRWLAQIKGEAHLGDTQPRLKVSPDIQFHLSDYQAEVRLTATASHIPGPITQMDRGEGQIFIPFDKQYLWSEWPARFRFTGTFPIPLNEKLRATMEEACQCQLPRSMRFQLPGQVWWRNRRLEARVSLEPLKNKLFDMDLAGEVVAPGGNEWRFEPKLDSNLRIHSFQALRKFLDKKNVIVPAPFDILDGTIDVTAKSGVARDNNGNKTDVRIVTALRSERQIVNLDGNVHVDANPDFTRFVTVSNLKVNDLQIELPPLDPIGGLPALMPDSRVQLQPETKRVKKPSAVTVDVMFGAHTTKPGAIRLLSGLAQPYVPLTFDFERHRKGDFSGSLKLEPFDLHYLRRKVHVSHLRFLMDNTEDAEVPVDGRFLIERTGYRIHVVVGGTLASPSIQLNSEPYLSRSDIISVLLFDRTGKELAGTDVETAGNFEAAVADRAIGLIGLWAFASTPIRGFYYNPVSHVYSATVKLSDSTSATLGTDWEQAASLEVRKRLSRRWVLTASWNPSESEQKSSLVLQWEKRF